MSKKRILVVDDESELVKAIQIRIELAGYEILVACNGREGLEKARKEKPDLIILDLMLPKMDGYKVCAMLKHDARYMKIPIIMLTARAQESDEKLGYECGAEAFITKPFQHEAVLAKIKELLKE
jgi:DNA-binding response OmpR family regulator